MNKAFAVWLAAPAALMASASNALADTVDAAAKPYMVGGGLVAFVALIGLGLFLIKLGQKRAWIARVSPGWPVADGKILTSKVFNAWHPTAGTYYVPRANYAYTVAGKTYQGHVIRAGLEQFGSGSKAAAQKHAEQYPVGSSVKVHYDPASPGFAVLETDVMGSGRNVFGGAICIMLGVAALVFAGWAGMLEPR